MSTNCFLTAECVDCPTKNVLLMRGLPSEIFSLDSSNLGNRSMIITLTTDFGYKDPFVGVMKGVISGINPRAQIVDLTHGIPPQDIMAGALVLRHSVAYFPRDTIHLAVVDPGVGSARRPLLMKIGAQYFLGPDNGLFSLVAANKPPDAVYELSNPSYHLQPTSLTFHGRDIFAPAAAHLSLGIEPTELGDAVDHYVRLRWPPIVKNAKGMDGEIVYIDGFGNLVTNVEARDLEMLPKERLSVSLRDMTIGGLAPNYAAGDKDRCIALTNSWGLLEIAMYKASAQQHTQAKIGDPVRISVNDT
jgi:S-adenosylmethionine hydrolase